jgi:hypothetical protein
MLTYENFVAVLLSSIERTGLNVAYTQELLDTHALGRSLSITCLPDGAADDQGPQEPALRAVIAFRWSPEFTVFSLRGGESLDNIESFVDERLYAQSHVGPSLDVEVSYSIPLGVEQQRDITQLPGIAQAVQELHSTLVDSEHMLRVDAQIAFIAGRAPRVQFVTGLRIYSIDEGLYDSELLSDTFDDLCAELHGMLQMLSIYYADPSQDEPGGESLHSDRRYLKPPTA